MEIKQITLKKQYIFLLLASISAILADLFFIDQARGIAYFIFICILTGLFCILLYFTNHLKKERNWFLLIPIFMLSIIQFILWNDLLFTLNCLLVTLLFIIFNLLLTGKLNSKTKKINFLSNILEAIFGPLKLFKKPLQLITNILKNPGNKDQKAITGKIIIGILLSLPFLAVIISLLSDADKIFNYIISKIPELLHLLDFEKFISHTIFIVFVSLYIFCYFWKMLTLNNIKKIKKHTATQKIMIWDPIIVITIMLLMNLIYIIFASVQFSYLFGGAEFTIPANMTYAQYARYGFFELAAVSIINLTFLVTTLYFINKDNPKIFKTIKILLTLIIIMTFIVLGSAYFRLNLYEEAYGYTYSRLFVNALLIFLFFIFLTSLIYIWKNNFPVFNVCLGAALSIYIIINFINIEKIIARKNINLYLKKNKIDIDYIKELKYDAVPELVRLLEVKDEIIAEQIKKQLLSLKEALPDETSWTSFHYARYKARKILNKLSVNL